MTKEKEVTGSVTASQRTRITNVLATAYGAKDKAGGTIAETMCDALIPLIPESGLGQADIDAITAGVARSRDWGRDTLKSRKTEIKAVLMAPKRLGGTIKKFSAHTGYCGWQNVVALARKLAAGKTPDESVRDVAAKKSSKKIDSREGAQKWVAMKLKSILSADAMEYTPKGFRKALIAFAVEHSLNVGATS